MALRSALRQARSRALTKHDLASRLASNGDVKETLLRDRRHGGGRRGGSARAISSTRHRLDYAAEAALISTRRARAGGKEPSGGQRDAAAEQRVRERAQTWWKASTGRRSERKEAAERQSHRAGKRGTTSYIQTGRATRVRKNCDRFAERTNRPGRQAARLRSPCLPRKTSARRSGAGCEGECLSALRDARMYACRRRIHACQRIERNETVAKIR